MRTSQRHRAAGGQGGLSAAQPSGRALVAMRAHGHRNGIPTIMLDWSAPRGPFKRADEFSCFPRPAGSVARCVEFQAGKPR
jgi:hypothetical protein